MYSKIGLIVRGFIQHYSHKKYWKLRNKIIEKNKYPKVLKYVWLLKLKRQDAFNNASLGTQINGGAIFKSTPNLPHGISGIYISPNAVIGNNCTIFHQVTIGEGKGGAPIIGDWCTICAGAKITGGIKIGNNVTIGTNCVVFEDIPDNTLVVMEKPRYITKNLD